MIGANHLPECLRERMTGPLLRWWTILLSYGWSDCAKSILCACTTISLTLMASQGLAGVQRVSAPRSVCYPPSSGFATFCRADHLLDVALREQHEATGSTDAYMRAGWYRCSAEYYDPMYRYRLEKAAKKSSFAALMAGGG